MKRKFRAFQIAAVFFGGGESWNRINEPNGPSGRIPENAEVRLVFAPGWVETDISGRKTGGG